MKLGIKTAGVVLIGLACVSSGGAALAETMAPKGVVPCDVPYVSGGFGLGSRQELDAASADYSLKLVFAEKGTGAYLSDVRVAIVDRKGAPVLEAISEGPWFLAKLKPGRYRVTVESGGASQVRHVNIPRKGRAERYFYWPGQ